MKPSKRNLAYVPQPNAEQWPAFKSNAERRGFREVQLCEGRVWWFNGRDPEIVQAPPETRKIILAAVGKGYR